MQGSIECFHFSYMLLSSETQLRLYGIQTLLYLILSHPDASPQRTAVHLLCWYFFAFLWKFSVYSHYQLGFWSNQREAFQVMVNIMTETAMEFTSFWSYRNKIHPFPLFFTCSFSVVSFWCHFCFFSSTLINCSSKSDFNVVLVPQNI